MASKRGPPGDALDGTPPEKKHQSESIADMIARKKREVEQRLAKQRGLTQDTRAESPDTSTARSTTGDLSKAEKIARLKARTSTNPVLRRLEKANRERESQDESKARGGLEVGLHPALMAESVPISSTGNRRKTTQRGRVERESTPAEKPKKQLEIVQPEDELDNPYFDRRSTAQPKNRVTGRQLMFNPAGKFIEQANALRQQAQIEALKKRIAMASRRAGLEEDMDTTAKAYKPEEPPTVEWWDSGLLQNETYDDIEKGNLKIDVPDSIITEYVQHPIPIQPPYEKNMPAAMTVKLTQKEMKRMRREKRAEVRKDEHDKQMLGLVPAPLPKVKIANMYSVYGDQAIKDPTKVEAEVRKQIQDRHDKHEQMNLERKLTPDQRREKEIMKKELDAGKGIKVCVYKINSLAHRPHRLKVDMNAQQDGLTGLCILNPKFCVVVVEGGPKGINHYKQLMLRRIDWNDFSRNREIAQGNAMADSAMDVEGDQPTNKCELVWEGELRDRSFRRWAFRRCATDDEARDLLKQRGRADNYWDIAKNFKDQDC